MDPVESALSYFERGCNCSQAVLAAFGPQLGLDPVACMHIAAAFGGGVARQGKLCGAVSGGLMLLGLKFGESPIGDPAVKEQLYQRAQAFMEAFAGRCGSVDCKELLGCDLSTPEGRQAMKERQLAKTHCPIFVRAAAEICAEFCK